MTGTATPQQQAPVQKIWTEAELEALPEDGYIHEVVNGELIMSPKNNFQHGNICTRLLIPLGTFVKENRLGAVLDSSTGFWMNNRNCRAPDISFIAKARLVAAGFNRRTKRFFPGAPDLAVEILSPNNTRTEVDARLRDFFASGAQLVWVIDPETESVEICHAPDRRQLAGPDGLLEGEYLLPGFRYRIADLFAPADWE